MAGLAVAALALGAGCGRGPATQVAAHTATTTASVDASATQTLAPVLGTEPPTLPATPLGPPTPTQTRVVQRTWTPAVPPWTPPPSPAPTTVTTVAVTTEVSTTVEVVETPILGTPTLETPTPLPPVIGPANAMSVTLRAAFGPGLEGVENLAVTPTVTATPAGGLAVRIDQVAWSPDGAWVAATGGFGVRVYAARTGTALWSARTPSWASSAAFSPNGRQLAAGTAGGTVLVFAAETGELEAVLFGKSGRVEALAWTQALTRTVLISLNGDTPHLWDVSAQAHLGSLPAERVARLAVSGGATPLAAVGAGSTVRVWILADLLQAQDPATAAPWRTLEQPTPLASLALSADGRRLAVGDNDGIVTVWNVPTGRPLHTFARLAAAAERLAFSPDGRLLASAHADRLARLWALGGTAAPLATLAGHADRITSLAFAPDGRALATAGWEGVARVWGVAGP